MATQDEDRSGKQMSVRAPVPSTEGRRGVVARSRGLAAGTRHPADGDLRFAFELAVATATYHILSDDSPSTDVDAEVFA